MVQLEVYPQFPKQSAAWRDLRLTCMDNLMNSGDAAERVYFKDLESRFLFVSAGWLDAEAAGCTEEEVLGKTDFDIFSQEHAAASFEDEQYIIRTGEPIVGKLERETFDDRPGAWVSTTKMPLRDSGGEIVGTFGITRDVTAQIRAEHALAYQALHDPVTGLANRVALMDRLSQALVAMERHPGRLAVVYVDIDHLKELNDSFGREAGDHVLAEIGDRLSLLSRHVDSVGRLGGDEFVVLCGALDDDDDDVVGQIGERIVLGTGELYGEGGRELAITCSVGIAVTSDPFAQPERLVSDAGEAMYEAKRAGRNCYRVYDATRSRTTGTRLLQAELNQAIDASELFVAYQPLISLEDRSLVGVEALVRWRHPERGIVQPNDFIPFAEEHGLIVAIGSFVLNEASRQLAEWTARDGWPVDFTMSVNVSGAELAGAELGGRVAEVVRRHGIDPARLCLEITETALVGEWGDIQETLSELSKLGVGIALDDFGTGYSTLAHLQRLKVDILKIDRSFVTQISRNPRDREIVAAVTAMSHALGIAVVAEGIETSHQYETLAQLGCDRGQGYLFARPLPPEEVAALVAEDRGEGVPGTHDLPASPR